jgi:hypothetical protein
MNMKMENRITRLVAQLSSLSQHINVWKREIIDHRDKADAAMAAFRSDRQTLVRAEATMASITAEIALFNALVARNTDVAGVRDGQISGFTFALESLQRDCAEVIADLKLLEAIDRNAA